MLKRDKLPPCPVETTLILMGDRWKLLIVRDLLTGTKRFSELKKSLTGIFPKSIDTTPPYHGGKRACSQRGLCRSPSKGRILVNRIREKSETDS